MSLNRSLKIMGYIHATLIFALIIPFLYAVAGLSDPAGSGVLYIKCLLVLVPVIIADRAAKGTKYLTVYLVICAALIAGVWGIAALFYPSEAYVICYCIGMSAEIFCIAFMRLRGRLKESPRRKESDPLAAKEEEFLDTPSLAFLWYFVVVYVLGIFLMSKALCDMAFYSAIVYLFLALFVTYFRETRSYLDMNKRVKGIPKRRLYGIGFFMLLIFCVLLLTGILPSVFLAKQRQYIDVSRWFDGMSFAPVEFPEFEGSSSDDMSMMEMMYGDEPVPEPSQFLNILFGVITFACMLAFAYGILLAVRRVFKDFRNGQDENGDIIEEIPDKEKSDREEMLVRGRRPAGSETERIKRRYRKMIRKHRKDRPAPHESPAEIEEGAGLKDDEQMQQLHKAYEEVRYGKHD
ncbi:MAG: hypothetical protein NC307_04400 [Roseburia sp.]|nr:hypothetical protein [Roseburia sp.]